MKPKNILIAALALIAFSSFLTGCSLIEKAPEKEAEVMKEAAPKSPKVPQKVADLVKKAEAAKKEVKLMLESEVEENRVTVTIKLDNPEKKPITSVQSWLSFDPEKIEGIELNTDDSAFQLPAPYTNDFDNKNGLLMLGRSNPEAVSDESIYVAEAVFDLIEGEVVAIDAYDYREDLTGHMSANVLIDEKPYNILIQPDSPALVIESQ